MTGDNEDLATRFNRNHVQAGGFWGFGDEKQPKYWALCHHDHNVKLPIDSVVMLHNILMYYRSRGMRLLSSQTWIFRVKY